MTAFASAQSATCATTARLTWRAAASTIPENYRRDLVHAARGCSSQEITVTNDIDGPGFAADIKPMFRERDHRAMQSRFDLWSHDDVSEHADAILARLRDGTMPCDGSWPAEQVDVFERWVDSGKRQ